MNTYRVTFTRTGSGIQSEIILATSEQQARDIFADCDILSVELDKQDYDAEMESQINAARIWTSNMHVTEDDMRAIHNYIVAAEAGDRAALAYGDAEIDRLNRHAGYDLFGAMASKSPDRVKWEQEYLAKRKAQTTSFFEVKR